MVHGITLMEMEISKKYMAGSYYLKADGQWHRANGFMMLLIKLEY